MNLLFDFISAAYKDGSVEYLRSVFFAVLSRIETENLGVHIYALYDSNFGIAYDDLQSEVLSNYDFLSYVDCANCSINDIVSDYKIDRFFIACSQKYEYRGDLEEVECDVICVIHDFYGEDYWQDKFELYLDMISPGADEPAKFSRLGALRKLPLLCSFLDKFDRFSIKYIKRGGNNWYLSLKNSNNTLFRLVERNSRVRLLTVSDASKYSFLYHYYKLRKPIEVLYPPERSFIAKPRIENQDLLDLVVSRKRYYLMVSSNRPAKNPYKLLNAFERFAELFPECYIVTLGLDKSFFPNHISLSFLSEADLDYALENMYALVYPSFYEGFGYPPLEAMHRCKPVLSSNTTSMPEVFGDAPIWFTPFYESSIFSALMKLTDDNYEVYSKRSKEQYEKIHLRQQSDLKRLVDIILE